MKMIIAGSRSIDDYQKVKEIIESCKFDFGKLVMGDASGVDNHAETWAVIHDVPYQIHTPDWGEFGKAAGPIRNERMAHQADALLAIWDGESSGTEDMINKAREYDLDIEIVRPCTV